MKGVCVVRNCNYKRSEGGYTLVEWGLTILSVIAIAVVLVEFFSGSLKHKVYRRVPSPVPWPAQSVPAANPLATAPAETDDLSKFKGYDAVVVTYTAEETIALATLFTPGFSPSHWYEYRHGLDNYIPLVTDDRASFNSTNSFMVRYYHSLGLYFPCTIGNAKVLLFKSGLHLNRDGQAVPLRKLMNEIIKAIQPKIIITTGNGGGIGQDTALGDVVIAGLTRFDCTGQFRDRDWHSASYKTTPVPAGALAEITSDLTSVNASRIQDYNARPIPKIWSGTNEAVVTTDSFKFDDSRNSHKLQGLGRACDMDDAMIGQVMQDYPNIKWFAIRNIAEPQIPNPDNNLEIAGNRASSIYSEYGVFTSAASIIATWAVIDYSINKEGK